MAECRIVCLISGSGSNAKAIIESCATQNHPGKVVSVISNRPEAKGLAFARSLGIQTIVIDHKEYPDRLLFDDALVKAIDSHQPDLLVLAGFMRVLGPKFTQRYRERLLNIHPSLLPKYKGLDTHQRAIEAGDKYAGASVHLVNEHLDGGAVILQAKEAIKPDDTKDTLAARVLQLEHQIYPQVVRWFCEDQLQLTSPPILAGQILYRPKQWPLKQ